MWGVENLKSYTSKILYSFGNETAEKYNQIQKYFEAKNRVNEK